jgi:predicted unusual protein kinase regulating ubiquinone biosynthesis (AarF/ABC1/UbiB family)
MDWLEGMHLKEFLATNPSQEIRNLIGQRLWDFYDFQIHQLKMVHADPHPGNFLMHADGKLGILDFGCVKTIPSSFYDPYFALLDTSVLKEKSKTMQIFEDLEFINPLDSPKEKEDFFNLFTSMIELLARPFQTPTFDFSDISYVDEIYQIADELKNNDQLRYSKHARGSQHGLYINRTYFGLYTLLHELGSEIVV